MDSSGWDNSSIIRNEISIPSSIWSHQYDNFSVPNNDYSVASGKVESMNQALLSSSLGLLQGMLSCETNADLNSVDEAVLDLLHRQQSARLTTDSMLSNFIPEAALGSETLSSPYELCSLPPTICLTEEIRDACNASSGTDHSESYTFYGKELGINHCSNLDEAAAVAVAQSSSNQERPPNVSLSSKRKWEDSCSLLNTSSSVQEGGFQIMFGTDPAKSKKTRLMESSSPGPSSIDFQMESSYEPDTEAIAQVKEMIYRAAALRPVNQWSEEAVLKKPKRKNVRISSDPQTVAARHRRERISERLRVLQRLVPGGSKMDTASMLDEAANYLKFLKSHVSALEKLGSSNMLEFMKTGSVLSFPVTLFPCKPFSHSQNPN